MKIFALRTGLVALALLVALAWGRSARADLTAYYTLNDLISGIMNQGTDGATSNLAAPNAGRTPAAITDGIIGGALRFDGGDQISSITAGNAGDDLTGYPFTMSVWVRNTVIDGGRDAAFAVSDRALADRYYLVGAQTVSGTGEAELVRRNAAFTALDATGTVTNDGDWHNIIGMFGPTTVQIYFDGELAASAATGQTFNTSVNTITLGGFLRSGSTDAPTDPFKGDLDDAGLFNTLLTATDAALINGLGRTGGIGLDQLDEAQALAAAGVGSTAVIGGETWQRVSGLAGTIGDFGGSVAGGDAFIVLDNAGNGIQLQAVPEAATLAAWLLGGIVAVAVAARRMRRRL